MRPKFAYILLSFLLPNFCFGQKIDFNLIKQKLKEGQKITNTDFNFKHYPILIKNDTVNVYTHQIDSSITPTKILIYIGGTGVDDLYYCSYDSISQNLDYWSSQSITDFRQIPPEYLFVVVSKYSKAFVSKKPSNIISQRFKDKNTLQDRVFQYNTAINYITKKILKKPKCIAVWGYSEGYYVASKLATVNKKITHLGVGGGGGYSDFLDFVILNRREYLRNQSTDSTSISNINATLDEYKKIMSDPKNTISDGEYTYKRWSSFSEPAYLNLVKIKIPIFYALCSLDESAPIENGLIVPLEFIRLGKNNLTTKIYPYEHSFIISNENGDKYYYKNALKDYFDFIEKNKNYR